jgi:predicted PhzF superfamily epimerase YddE/YHI9
MQEDQGWTTVAVVFQDESGVIHARNLFAVGGVVEDPATGAAAAALAGHLRDSRYWQGGRLVLRQGEDMGQPCLLYVDAVAVQHQGVTVSGLVRPL